MSHPLLLFNTCDGVVWAMFSISFWFLPRAVFLGTALLLAGRWHLSSVLSSPSCPSKVKSPAHGHLSFQGRKYIWSPAGPQGVGEDGWWHHSTEGAFFFCWIKKMATVFYKCTAMDVPCAEKGYILRCCSLTTTSNWDHAATHSLSHQVGWGRESEREKLMHWDKNGLIGQQRKRKQ